MKTCSEYKKDYPVLWKAKTKEHGALFNLETFEWHWTSKARNSSKFEELSEHYRSSYIPKIVRFFNKQKR